MYNADTRKIVGTGSLTSELSSASAVEQTTKVGFGSNSAVATCSLIDSNECGV